MMAGKGTIARDLVGLRVGKLTVLRINHEVRRDRGRRLYWRCMCDCGKECVVQGNNLQAKHSRGTYSCGCVKRKVKSFNRSMLLLNWRVVR